MLDDTSEEDMCLCKRKKSQSWNEISILETQHPSRQDPSSTQPCYWDIADRTWQSFTIDDEDSNTSGCSHDQQPMSLKSDQEAETEELLEKPRPPDQVQVMDTSPAGMHTSLGAASREEVLEEESTDLEDRERTSFEELRKAYIRETRQVLLDKAFEVECSDEDEIDQETEEGTLPDVQSTSRSLTSDTDPADAADPDGGEWSGQTSQSLQTENRD